MLSKMNKFCFLQNTHNLNSLRLV